MANKSMTLREAAIELLRAGGPKHYEKLTEEILAKRLASSSGKTPAASLNAMIAVDIKRNGTKSEFVRVRPGVFGLRALHAASAMPEMPPGEVLPGPGGPTAGEPKRDESEQRVRTPLFPTYSEVRHLLKVWPGRPRKQVTGLQAALADYAGLSPSYLAEVERGGRNPSLEVLYNLAATFNVSAGYLIDGAPSGLPDGLGKMAELWPGLRAHERGALLQLAGLLHSSSKLAPARRPRSSSKPKRRA